MSADPETSRTLLGAVIGAAPGPVAVFDATGRRLAASAAWRGAFAAVEDIAPDALRAACAELAAGDGAARRVLERAVPHDDGAERRLRWELQGWRTEDGAARGAVAIACDRGAAAPVPHDSDSLLAEVIEALPDGFAIYDPDDRLLMLNSAMRALHAPVAELLDQRPTFEEVIRAGVAAGMWRIEGEDVEAWVRRQLDARARPGLLETTVRLADGRWMRRRERLLASGHRVGLRMDVTDDMRREEELKTAGAAAAEARLRLLEAIEAIPDAFALYDADDRLLMCNAGYRDAYRSVDEMLQPGVAFEDLLREWVARGGAPVEPDGEDAWIAWRMERHRTPPEVFEMETAEGAVLEIRQRRTRTGDLVGLRTDVTELRRQRQALEAYAAELSQATSLAVERNRALEAANARIAEAALRDTLTGLGNRRWLDRRLAAAAAAGEGAAILHIDLDRFKLINDTLGHDLGDAVLARAAETVRTVAEAGDEIARIGGDEFVVARFGSQATGARRPDRDTLSALAGELLQALGAPMELNGHPCRVGASIGIASAAPGEIDPKQLLIDADIALNRAKTDGRNRWEFFTAEMQAERLATKRMADAIFGGLETDAFIPYYQPQFCARSGRVNGVEALARLRMPDGAILPPGAFLSVADNLDATAEIDRMIMRRAAEDWLALRAEGIELRKLSVNVSARRLTDPRLASDVEALGMPTEALSVELLESTFLDDPDDAARWAIDRLQELGVAIEVDDFGAGHASIVSVMRLRPARLKIDRALVAPIDACPQARQLLRSILDIGRALGARVIAEGVETLNHADLLVEMGCDALQGYAFAKPMPREALARFLREKPWRRTLARHASGS